MAREDATERPGIAGRLAAAFVESRLTPLVVIASVLLGIGAVVLLPREEEPQIKVPMIDVFVAMPGAAAREVEERVTKPMEQLLWEIPGVEYVYSSSRAGGSLAIVRFEVGEDEEDAIVRLNQKMFANFDRIPPGASGPLVKPRSIDDVPILALTLWSERYDSFTLRTLAAEVADRVKPIDDVSEVTLIGGQRRQLRVTLDSSLMASAGVSPSGIAAALGAANRQLRAGSVSTGNRELVIETGGFLSSAEEVGGVVIGARGGRPVHLRDVAVIADGPEEPADYVFYRPGRASSRAGGPFPAVTVAIAKRKGTNAITVAERVLDRVEEMKGDLIPGDVFIALARHSGETAREKSNELLFHMGLAIVSVTILIGVTLGVRESGIVAIAIPVTLALTLVVFFLYGYTLNRVTLFALIFSIGILVDDAIVVVENIVRHDRLPGAHRRSLREVALAAVDEVGNPTILATFTVIAAILPMAFVSGLMGPYMRPIPVGASAAMLFSLLVAFVVTPWAAIRLLRRSSGETGGGHEAESWSTRGYRRIMTPLLADPRWRWGFLAGVAVLLVLAAALVPAKLVLVKMLPFDNKNEFEIVIDMPEGSTLEGTAAAAREVARVLDDVPEVEGTGVYVGTAAPYNFNGLVRHYFLRRGPNVAGLQVTLAPKHERRRQSHEIASAVRPLAAEVAARHGARVQVAEVPPGPPVLQTLVAEIYGPDSARRIAVAREVREIFEATDGVVDVDWTVEDPQPKVRFLIDHEKAALHGVSAAEVSETLRLAVTGGPAGLLHRPEAKEDVPIVLRLPRAERSSVRDLGEIRLPGAGGAPVPLAELVRVEETMEPPSLHRKNLLPVVYVTADVGGREESPVYAILKLQEKVAAIELPEGGAIEQYTAGLPASDERLALKWDGEWHVTYEVFRDLGVAFGAVLILIYILVVGWFQSFRTPLVIMAAIPFSLVGILPAHAAMGAFFTATSMIGFIAGAGIVVRNSIILVDFIEIRRAQGMPLAEAVVDAGAVRFRPMLLTAAAVIVGASVILFDPIFQGLAISLMAGEVASLLLSRMTVPILYFLGERGRELPPSAAPRGRAAGATG